MSNKPYREPAISLIPWLESLSVVEKAETFGNNVTLRLRCEPEQKEEMKSKLYQLLRSFDYRCNPVPKKDNIVISIGTAYIGEVYRLLKTFSF